MTVGDLLRILALSPKPIEVQLYDERYNRYDSLCGIEEYEVLYIQDWQVGTHEPNALEQWNYNCLRLSIAIASPKAMIEATNTIKEIYDLTLSKER